MEKLRFPILILSMLTVLFNGCKKTEETRPGKTEGPKEIIIKVEAPPPVYENNRRVLLDASPTNLANKSRIYYYWTCTAFPPGSRHKIIKPREAATMVDSLIVGRYTFQLDATDDFGNTARAGFDVDVLPDTLAKKPPVINPLPDQFLLLPKDTVWLNGDINYRVNPLNRELIYKWSVIQQPAGSPVVMINKINNANTYATRFAAGNYLFSLELTNEFGLKSFDTLELKVIPDSLSGTTKIYNDIPWMLNDDGWGPYVYLSLEDGDVFLNRNENSIYVHIWNEAKNDWYSSQGFYWVIRGKALLIFNIDYTNETFIGKKARVQVMFL
jgi:hypothetical protein